jgi:uncharacterized protein (DUF983 family)
MPHKGDQEPVLSPAEVFRREAEAEEAQAQLVAESAAQLDDRCPECGALGSLELFDDGQRRCVDCDAEVAAVRPLGGMGRK